MKFEIESTCSNSFGIQCQSKQDPLASVKVISFIINILLEMQTFIYNKLQA